MNSINQARKLILFNLRALVGFEVLFKLITLLIATPLFLSAFDLIMKITGYSYLTLENAFSFLFQPLSIFALLILLVLMTAYTMFDLTTVIIILDQSRQEHRVRILDALLLSLRRCGRILRFCSLPLAFLTLFLLPVLNLGMASSFISTIQIPEFIMEFIQQNRIVLAVFILCILVLTVILLRWLYSLHYLVLEDVSFSEARRRSRQLGKKNHGKDFLMLAAVQLAITVFYSLFLALGIGIIVATDSWLRTITLLNSLAATVIWLFLLLSLSVFLSLSTPVSYACISVLFYAHKQEEGEDIHPLYLKQNKQAPRERHQLRRLIVFVGAVSILTGTIFIYGVQMGYYNLNIEYTRMTEVTAHRGDSAGCPENTMAAFVSACEQGADWIELDVQQTSDGEIIVIHDTNLKRTTGLNKNTWELTVEEVRQLDAGSFFSKDFQGERIPLLTEVIEFAKDHHIRLNIELKPTGHETDFEKTVVGLIEAYDFVNQCVVTSQVYQVLENVKACNPDIQTVYVMSFAYGNIMSLSAADHFSIEASSISSFLVSRVHQAGKQLYAWTLNSEDNISKMVELNVDNIITDHVALAKNVIYKEKTTDLVTEYVKLIKRIF